MASLNRVDLIGNIGQDIELRYLPDGSASANISLATTSKWKGNNGVLQERTEWHRLVCYGKTAELAAEYLQKGSMVFFSGRLQYRKWDDKEGQEHYSTEIVVQTMQFLGATRNKPAADNHGADKPAQDAPMTNQDKPKSARRSRPAPKTSADIPDSEVPF
jgi:single-strand DNA-binding protein